jgi:large subunit ribosomal protein L17
MRHRKNTSRKFHRKTGPRRAFLRNLASDLVRHGKIVTTETRAKAIRPIMERLVTIAKRQTLASRRLVISRLGNKDVATRLFDEIAPRYKERPGGYLRITKSSGTRKRDSAPVATIEFV